MTTHLVIGDPHCTPAASNERFTWAGKMAKDIGADKIICMLAWTLCLAGIEVRSPFKVEDIVKI